MKKSENRKKKRSNRRKERIDMKHKKIDQTSYKTVVEMWVGEWIFLVMCECAGFFFAGSNLVSYSVGLLCGVLLAMAATYHMWWVLDRALDFDEKTAQKMISTKYLVRYFAVILLLLVLWATKIGNPFAAFLGYMGLKVGAYLQPLVDKIYRIVMRKGGE